MVCRKYICKIFEIFLDFAKTKYENKVKGEELTHLNWFYLPKNLAANVYTNKTHNQETLRLQVHPNCHFSPQTTQ